MNKQLKECYSILDLELSATSEQVELRQKALVAYLRDKQVKTGKPQNEKIKQVKEAGDTICAHIKKFGVPEKEQATQSRICLFQHLVTALIVLLLVAIVLVVTII